MQLLYSNILPLKTKPGQQQFIDQFIAGMQEADRVDIAVGYVSKASLQELEEFVKKYEIHNVSLNIGMYYLEGMPERTYHEAVVLNEVWRAQNVGEVRMVRPFKYHGKLYAFYKDERVFKAIVGSHNLGAIKLEANNLRQYEISAVTEETSEAQEIASFIDDLKQSKCSVNIAEIENMKIVRELNNALVGQEFVDKVTDEQVSAYQDSLTDISFEIPLKVPKDKNDTKMRGSNINVCYANGRKRVWWEIEMVVPKEIRKLTGYPEYQKPFMCITDDGWKFQAWTCGDNNKNFYSKDDLKIMGRWLKGRLVAAGLVDAVNNVDEDSDVKGLITGEVLKSYGRDTITLTKTSQPPIEMPDGTKEDIWMLSFLPESRLGKKDSE